MKCCAESLLQDNQLCDRARRQPITKEHDEDNAVCRSTRLRTGRPRQGGAIQTYNQETHVCTTNGNVLVRLPGEQICGQKLFNPASELCCGGRIFSVNDQYGNPRECCGNSVFVYAPSLQCCFGNRVENIPQNVAGLCRNRAYNVNTSSCYRNSVVRRRCDIDNYPDLCSTGSDPSLWIPYNPRDNECCGETLIGPGQTCCSGQVYATPGTTIGSGRCCRDEGGYNPAEEICCNGRLFMTNGTDMECCGNRPFDLLDGAETCCDDKLYSSDSRQTLCTDGVAHSPIETVCNGVLYGVANGDCCGRSIINDTTICCDGHMYSKVDHGTHCCGRVAYDPASQPSPLCCGDSLYTDAPTLQCCGNQAIDTTERQCCSTAGHQFALLRTSGQSCCGGSDGYDETLHTCCQGMLHKFITDGECCGQGVVRDPSQEICCNGRIQARDYGDHTICCNNIIRDARRVICCGNASVSRQSKWQECCNGVVINKGEQQCPDTDIQTRGLQDADIQTRGLEDTTHRIYARQTEHAQRVAGNGTDAMELGIETTTNADGRTPHLERMMPRDATKTTGVVCNGLAYDPNTQGCCHGTLYKLTNETCMGGLIGGICDGIAYNPSTHGCCGVIVFNRTTEYCDEIVSPSADQDSEISDGTQPTVNATLRPLCGGVIYDRLQHGCCGDQLYNLSSEYCGESETVIPRIAEQPDELSTTRVTTISSYETSTVPDSTEYPEISEEECNVLRAQENVTDDYQCCQSLLYRPENATCCQGISSSNNGTAVIWSAVTVGVAYGRCCNQTAYDSSEEVCCNERILAKTWLTPDSFNTCCKPGEKWNRFLDSCETAPTYEPFMEDETETSGMTPEE
ncbi:uncharacterized protein LOC117290279 [Asterias rubens]|uniref:uncharacterized protein LOC117290279 n=1 Tax=Asterias rubens TaxID=7604 RepID=UPI0014559BEC|nr:uncharacterized protein LOC117290279 [Asterias rubens]